MSAELLDEAVATLTNLDFISAKCAAELVFDLKEDYETAIAVLPEARAEIEQSRYFELVFARWAQALLDCARRRRLPDPKEIVASAVISLRQLAK